MQQQFLQLLNLCDIIINSSEEVLDKSKLLAIIQSEAPAIQCQHSPVQLSPIKFDEMTNNKLMCVALRVKAEEMGYTVTMNNSSIAQLDNSKASKYFRSRPDLVMYKENRVYIVMENEPASDETSEESTDKTTTTTILLPST